METSAIRLLVIVGPTAAGKSALAVEAALALGGEIVSADSVQVYRGLDIGAAKPSRKVRDRVQHWCIDLVDPSTVFDAAQWVAHATEAIDDIAQRGRVPIVVGGTGFYIRALLSGLHEIGGVDPKIRDQVRDELERRGAPAMHAELQTVDPLSAARISPTDPQRIGRALEVFRSTGTTLSDHFQDTRSPILYDAMTFGLWPPRERLYETINHRAGEMLSNGLVDEVRGLIENGVSDNQGPLTSLGYRQVVQHLQGDIPADRLHESIAIGHRHYARRQLTWFRGITTRENQLIHIDPTQGDALTTLLDHWQTHDRPPTAT